MAFLNVTRVCTCVCICVCTRVCLCVCTHTFLRTKLHNNVQLYSIEGGSLLVPLLEYCALFGTMFSEAL